MSLARRSGNDPPRGMLSMDDMLHVPFDQLWSHAQGVGGTFGAMPQHEMLPAMEPVAVEDPHPMNWGMGSHGYFTEEMAPREFQLHNFRWLDTEGRWVFTGDPTPDPEYTELAQLGEDRVLRGVKPRVLRKQKTRSATREDSEQSCNICMEAFKPSCKIMSLPCKHSFCKGCISQWLGSHDTCPVCRWKFPEDHTHIINASNR
eukprot:evm.model.scf_219.10 EVM.evm.TU.scf_219.10   scf_219:91439-95105(+)